MKLITFFNGFKNETWQYVAIQETKLQYVVTTSEGFEWNIAKDDVVELMEVVWLYFGGVRHGLYFMKDEQVKAYNPQDVQDYVFRPRWQAIHHGKRGEYITCWGERQYIKEIKEYTGNLKFA